MFKTDLCLMFKKNRMKEYGITYRNDWNNCIYLFDTCTVEFRAERQSVKFDGTAITVAEIY